MLSKELAKIELEKWLDYKKVKPKKRTSHAAIIDSLEDFFVEGNLRLDKDFNLIQSLDFPIKNKDGDITVTELTYKPFLLVGDVHDKVPTVDNRNQDAEIKLLIITAALTSKPASIIRNLNTEDNTIPQLISSFFV